MFHIDATFEDIRIIARQPKPGEGNGSLPPGMEYFVRFIDMFTGESKQLVLPVSQLDMILQFNLHPDGEPEHYQEFYEILEPIFKDWPSSLRPIP